MLALTGRGSEAAPSPSVTPLGSHSNILSSLEFKQLRRRPAHAYPYPGKALRLLIGPSVTPSGYVLIHFELS